MAFPASPTDQQQYVNNGVTYVYSAAMNVWNTQGSVTTASPVSSVAGRTGAVVLTAADIGSGAFPSTITTAILIANGNIVANSGTASSNTTSGAIVVNGGMGVSGNIYAGGLYVSAINNTPIGGTTASSGAFTTLTSSGGAQLNSLGLGTSAPGTTGQILATNSITAYYSDGRLKDRVAPIENALDKIDQLSGFLYRENDLAKSFGFNNSELQVGVDANAVKAVQPEATALAPFDRAADGSSKSGEHYLTVMYEKLVPLLIEGIKELRQEINTLKGIQ